MTQRLLAVLCVLCFISPLFTQRQYFDRTYTRNWRLGNTGFTFTPSIDLPIMMSNADGAPVYFEEQGFRCFPTGLSGDGTPAPGMTIQVEPTPTDVGYSPRIYTVSMTTATNFVGTLYARGLARDTGSIIFDEHILNITFQFTNSPPIVPSNYTSVPWRDNVLIYKILTMATDPNGDPLTYVSHTSVSPSGCGTATWTNNQIVFTSGTYFGNCTFAYTVTDGPAQATANITVNLTNNPPITTPKFFSRHWSLVKSGLTVTNVIAGDYDLDGDPISLQSVGNPSPVEADAGKSSTSSMLVTYRSGSTFVNNNLTIPYVLTDVISNTSGIVTLFVSNNVPVGVDDTFVVNGTTGSVFTLNVLQNDVDADQPTYDNVLIVSSFTQPSLGTLTLSGDSTRFFYLPPNNVSQVITFTYKVTDGISISQNTTVTIHVKNHVPQQIMAFGNNLVGQLGLGDALPRARPDYLTYFGQTLVKQICSSVITTFFVLANGDLHVVGNGGFTPTLVVSNVHSISCGPYHLLAKTTNNQLYSLGYGDAGRLGLGDNNNRTSLTLIQTLVNVDLFKAGGRHSAALNGTNMTTWGYNGVGALGLGDLVDRNIPTVLTLPTFPSNRVVQFALGDIHSIVLSKNGQIWVFGGNQNGQLGLSDTINRNVPTLLPFTSRAYLLAAGNSHTMIMTTNRVLYAFGRNQEGQLGLGDLSDRSTPSLVAFTPNMVSTGTEYTLVSNAIGTFSFGRNSLGQLGIGLVVGVNSPQLVVDQNYPTATFGESSFIRLCVTPGYTGLECAQPICYGIDAMNYTTCSQNGKCTAPDTCSCDQGYVGLQCQLPVCFGKNASDVAVCSGKGSCLSPDNCKCAPLYSGSQCEVFLSCADKNASDPLVCNARGACNIPETCSCNAGYAGQYCELTQCFGKNDTDPTVCTSRGNCTGPNTCSCSNANNYGGSECQTAKCYGKLATDTSVCGGKGACTAPQTCTCATGYSGNECDAYQCFGVAKSDPKVCYAKGSCTAPDTCSCSGVDYFGPKCDQWKCFEILSTSPSACSGNGNCTSPGTCTCNTGFSGNQCETAPQTTNNLYYLLILLVLVPVGGVVVLAGAGIGIAVIVKFATPTGGPLKPQNVAMHDLGI